MKKSVLCGICLILLLAAQSVVLSEVSVTPFGFGMAIEEGGQEEIELTLHNNGESEVSYTLRSRVVSEQHQGQRGPLRDEPGEILAQHDVPYFNTVGLAYDPEHSWIWGLAWTDRRIYAYDPANRRVIVNVLHNQALLGLFYHDGVLYAGGYDNNPNVIFRFDTQGQMLDQWRIQRSLRRTDIAGDGQFIYTLTYEDGGGRGDVHVYPMENNAEEIGVIDCSEWTGVDVWGVELIPEHRSECLWIAGRDRMYQFQLDEDWQADLVQEFETVETIHTGLAHDGENLWRGIYDGQTRIWYVIDDGVTERLDIRADPASDVLGANEETALNIEIHTEGVEPGVYEVLFTLRLSEAGEEDPPVLSSVEFTGIVSIGRPVLSIAGLVTDADDEQPLSGAEVSIDRYLLTRTTADDGNFAFTDIPPGNYQLTFTARDYLMFTLDVDLDGEDVADADVALLHSRCVPDPEAIVRDIAPDFSLDLTLDVHNTGNGPLSWTVERKLLGDANADPWVLRNSLYVGEEVDDTYIMGAVFDGVNFYVSGSNDNSPVIYIFDRDGNLQDSFDQPGDDRRGLRDLAWDGNLIWGADSDNIYGFNRAGEVQYTLDAPFSPTSNITWDPIHQWLWVSTTTTNIIALDLNGDQQAVVDRQGLRVYGLGFYADDPDGYNLYIFAKEPDTDRPYIHKANTDEDDLMFIEYLDTDIGISPSGIFITNQYDIYSYVMVATMNAPGNIGGDRIDIWQVDARKSWMQIDPEAGVIDAGATGEFDVVLDATGLPPEIFEGEFVFTHDGVGSETHVPVRLNVVEGPVEAELTLDFEQGWNMVSVYLQPDEEDIMVLTRPLVEEDLLLLWKNGAGNFYSPIDAFCNIPGWFVDEGYLVKVTEPCELTIAGMTVVQDEPIDLVEGWQMISCYLRSPVDAIVALSGIVDNLVIAKDGWGNFYKPDWDFSNMGDMIHSRGYIVKMTEDTQLIYRLFLEDDELDHVQQRSVYASPGRLGVHPVTGANMSLALIAGSGFEAPVGETEIGVYASGELVGSGILQGGRCGIAVWGDDPSTPAVDGALAGEALEIRVLDVSGLRAAEGVTLAGSPSYETDSFWAVELTGAEVVPAEFGITSAYPNPFNENTRFAVHLPDAANIKVSVFDLNGRLVETLIQGRRTAGTHMVIWNAESTTAGTYIIQVNTPTKKAVQKITLVK